MIELFSTLRNRKLNLFLAARFFATMAVQIQSIAIGWQIYELSGDPLDLGLVGLAQFLPFIPMSLLAGHIVDKWDRRRILTYCYLAESLCALLFVGFSLSNLQVKWPVFIILALYGSARAFMNPASQALLVNLVPPKHLGSAIAMNASIFKLAIISGPVAGGFLYALGPSHLYGLVAFTLGVSTLLMFFTGRSPTKKDDDALKRDHSSIFEGLYYLKSRRVLLGALSLDLFAVLFGGATALLPAYARDVLSAGPEALGLLRSASALGAALMALALAFRPIRKRVGVWMFTGVFIFGIATIAFGLSTHFWVSVVTLLAMGAGDMLSVYIRQLLVQTGTPDAIRGRVSAVNSLFIGASNELGEFESGFAAAWIGLVPAVVLGGSATLVIGLIWLAAFPELRRLKSFNEVSAEHN